VIDGVLARGLATLAIERMPALGRGLLEGGEEIGAILPVGQLHAVLKADLQAEVRPDHVIDVPRRELCA
jgi:hypothetical protein